MKEDVPKTKKPSVEQLKKTTFLAIAGTATDRRMREDLMYGPIQLYANTERAAEALKVLLGSPGINMQTWELVKELHLHLEARLSKPKPTAPTGAGPKTFSDEVSFQLLMWIAWSANNPEKKKQLVKFWGIRGELSRSLEEVEAAWKGASWAEPGFETVSSMRRAAKKNKANYQNEEFHYPVINPDVEGSELDEKLRGLKRTTIRRLLESGGRVITHFHSSPRTFNIKSGQDLEEYIVFRLERVALYKFE